MKLTDWMVNTFGNDKILHFFGGGWITSMFSPFGWTGILIAFAIVIILSFIKESFLDDIFDGKDILAAIIGGTVSIGIFALISLLL